LVAFWEEEIKCQSISATEKLQKEPVLDCKVPICFNDDEISCIIKDLLDPSAGFARSTALQKYLSVGEWLYKETRQLNEQICHFEANIQRSYFHVKPLNASQLENWHHYLDFVEMQGDFDWVGWFYIILVLMWTMPVHPPPPFHSLPPLRISNTPSFH
jgi:pre-mRNA-processing factor 39